MRTPSKALRFLLVFPLIVGLAVASPTTDQLRYYLQTADCDYLATDHAIDLFVLDKRFPLPRGFNFYGFEVGEIAFRKVPDLDPLEYIEQHPGATASDAAHHLSAQRASVTYYTVEHQEDIDSPDFDGFEPLEWRGISLLYRVSVGGRQVETTVHQVIVRADDQLERLRIASTNPEQITNIIACASDYQ